MWPGNIGTLPTAWGAYFLHTMYCDLYLQSNWYIYLSGINLFPTSRLSVAWQRAQLVLCHRWFTETVMSSFTHLNHFPWSTPLVLCVVNRFFAETFPEGAVEFLGRWKHICTYSTNLTLWYLIILNESELFDSAFLAVKSFCQSSVHFVLNAFHSGPGRWTCVEKIVQVCNKFL